MTVAGVVAEAGVVARVVAEGRAGAGVGVDKQQKQKEAMGFWSP